MGDLTVRALPFYGEQPTDQEGVHPGLRNIGSTWTVKGNGTSAAFFADTGLNELEMHRARAASTLLVLGGVARKPASTPDACTGSAWESAINAAMRTLPSGSLRRSRSSAKASGPW